MPRPAPTLPLELQRTSQTHPLCGRTSSQATAPLGPSYLFNARFVSAPQGGGAWLLAHACAAPPGCPTHEFQAALQPHNLPSFPLRAPQKKVASAAVCEKRKRGATGELCDCEEVMVSCARKLRTQCNDYTTLDLSYDDCNVCTKCEPAGGLREGGGSLHAAVLGDGLPWPPLGGGSLAYTWPTISPLPPHLCTVGGWRRSSGSSARR